MPWGLALVFKAMALQERKYIDAGDFIFALTMGTLFNVLLSYALTEGAVESAPLNTGGELCLDKLENTRNGERGFPVVM